MIHVGDKEVTAVRVGERVVAAVYRSQAGLAGDKELFRRGLLAR